MPLCSSAAPSQVASSLGQVATHMQSGYSATEPSISASLATWPQTINLYYILPRPLVGLQCTNNNRTLPIPIDSNRFPIIPC